MSRHGSTTNVHCALLIVNNLQLLHHRLVLTVTQFVHMLHILIYVRCPNVVPVADWASEGTVASSVGPFYPFLP